MGAGQSAGQETGPNRVTVVVSAAEKQAIRAVAAARETTESDLLRSTLIPDILNEYERIRAVVLGAA